jgi:hypothetical protein
MLVCAFNRGSECVSHLLEELQSTYNKLLKCLNLQSNFLIEVFPIEMIECLFDSLKDRGYVRVLVLLEDFVQIGLRREKDFVKL